MHFIKMRFRLICFRVARHIINRRVKEQHFATSGITTIPQVWSTNQIIAEIGFEVNSESCLNNSLGEDDDSNQEANPAQCFNMPEAVSAAEREAHSLTHMPFRSWCTVCQRAKGQQHYHQSKQKALNVIQLDHSFYKVNLKALTFVETVTSISGAVIVPDLSVNKVAIKALKKFIAINGFAKSVLQSDGYSGLLQLQEQVGCEMSLPTQVSPPYSHQSQGTAKSFHKALYGQVRAIRIGLAIISEFSRTKWKVHFFIGSFNAQHVRSNATS